MQAPVSDCPSKLEHKFFTSPAGTRFLHRLILATTHTIRYGSSGIREIQEFLEPSKLNVWVASSTGALHSWVTKVETTILRFEHE